MNARAFAIIGLLVVSLLVPTFTHGQSRRSKTDKDIDAIGQRNIARGPNDYSLKREEQLGERLAQEVGRQYKFVTDSEIIAYLERVDQKLEQNSDKHIPMKLHVIDSDKISAYTLLGGQQFVTRGLLLRTGSEGELASLLGRGIAMTALRSQTKLATELNQGLLSGLAVGSLPSGGIVMSDGPETIQAKHDADFDADYFGIQYLYKSGYDPNCFIEFIRQLGDTSKTSPPLSKRLQALQKEMSDILPKRDGSVVTTPEFQQFKNRLQAITTGAVASKNPSNDH